MFDWENAHVDQLPNRVFMTMVENDVYAEIIAKSPFNFKHFSASQVVIFLNEEMRAPSSSALLVINTLMDTRVYLRQWGK